MRVPRLVWHRKHNVAAITVSFGGRIWHTREVGDFILGYNAAGRLTKVVILDPGSVLTTPEDTAGGLARVTETLLRTAEIDQRDLDVLRSALQRAERYEADRLERSS